MCACVAPPVRVWGLAESVCLVEANRLEVVTFDVEHERREAAFTSVRVGCLDLSRSQASVRVGSGVA